MTSIYFNHMMKTGGRTASKVIFESLGLPGEPRFKSGHKMCNFSAWDITATIIREPTSRLLSHYRMLMQHELSGFSIPPHREAELGADDPVWLGDNFEDFLINFPNKWKLHQLYFYSKTGDVGEAFSNIIQNTQIILFERREEGFGRLANKLRLDDKIGARLELKGGGRKAPKFFQDQKPPEWQTTKNISLKVDDDQALKMKKVLEKEYEFYNRVIDYYNWESVHYEFYNRVIDYYNEEKI